MNCLFSFMTGFRISATASIQWKKRSAESGLVRRFLRATEIHPLGAANYQESSRASQKHWPDISADALARWDDTQFNMFGKQGQISWTGHRRSRSGEHMMLLQG